MTISEEQRFLLNAVEGWFNRPDQLEYYAMECGQAPTEAEKHLLNGMPGEGAVLDIGCGAGRISFILAENGYEVTGIDVSEGLLKMARHFALDKQLAITFLQNEGAKLPFPDETFASAVVFKVLCYLPTRELRSEFLSELYRVLKPGGICVLTQHIVPDEYQEDGRDEHFAKSEASRFSILERGDHLPLGVGYVHWFTVDELWQELGDTNFDIDTFESDEAYGGAGFIQLIRLRKSPID
ncbi:class I SAM-dependent methyltransferase [Paenibacillus sp. CAU 1782]